MAVDDDQRAEPTAAVVPRLGPEERRRAWGAGLVPVLLATVVLVGLAGAGRATFGDVVVGVLFYGGLLGLTIGVVVHERLQAGHCPRCDAAGQLRRSACGDCGYDLATRPMFRCEERHRRYVEPGLCACGRRLHRLEPVRGVDREIRRTLWAGAWLGAFLLGVTLLLPFVD